ncbi:elongation factor P--(R)-beta-lysine ligase [Aliiglaciecola sp. LCG003]|uniref:elongation factor P--(R)-beta-lysine ligase n=1 Tax=Aliiglaciecola sp. LCG003 TaxID=3053655 RepID=UPI0025738C48|nr:elongation factor P--(R)-beta-lysine ligase [Aliiglaciecola sp. LCG003]WJG09014.1 elongation factor P--(R)-beta-lysine ligase [Aliiglaciecola sp. LCG003]
MPMSQSHPWQPSASLHMLKHRATILTQIRQFFQQRDVMEVETPALANFSVTDIHLSAFQTEFISPIATGSKTLYLQTSPEYAMKRLLAAGSGCIYQICKSFRNEEAGRHHNPEFTMLEWYRVNLDHLQLIDEVDALLQLTLGCDPLEKLSYQDAFIRYCQLDPLSANLNQIKKTASELGFANIAIGETSKDTLLQLLCSQVVEPQIGLDRPVALINFPASQSALAQIDQSDTRVAQRFEIYFKGVELANGYHELTDADEHLQRFKQDNLMRANSGAAEIPIDGYFIQAIKHGLPNCAGVALGLDRLMMLSANCANIGAVMSFTVNHA